MARWFHPNEVIITRSSGQDPDDVGGGQLNDLERFDSDEPAGGDDLERFDSDEAAGGSNPILEIQRRQAEDRRRNEADRRRRAAIEAYEEQERRQRELRARREAEERRRRIEAEQRRTLGQPRTPSGDDDDDEEERQRQEEEDERREREEEEREAERERREAEEERRRLEAEEEEDRRREAEQEREDRELEDRRRREEEMRRQIEERRRREERERREEEERERREQEAERRRREQEERERREQEQRDRDREERDRLIQEEADRRRREREQREQEERERRAQEEADRRRRAQQEADRRRRERRAQEEADRRRREQEEEEERRRREEEERRREEEAEEERRRLQALEDEIRRRQAAEAERRRQAEEDRRRAEEERRRQELIEQEILRRQQEEEDRRRRQREEDERRRQIEIQQGGTLGQTPSDDDDDDEDESPGANPAGFIAAKPTTVDDDDDVELQVRYSDLVSTVYGRPDWPVHESEIEYVIVLYLQILHLDIDPRNVVIIYDYGDPGGTGSGDTGGTGRSDVPGSGDTGGTGDTGGGGGTPVDEDRPDPSFDASPAQPDLYYYDPNVGLYRIDRSEFSDGEGPIPRTELPDASTPAGRRALANLFSSLPDNVYYDPEIGHFIEIDSQGRHVIQADFSDHFDTEGRPPRGAFDSPRNPLGGSDPTLYFYDSNRGYVEIDRAEFTDGTPPIPITELPDDSTPNGRQRLAQMFATLPDNMYYDPEIGHFVQEQSGGRHVVQANLEGYFPGGEQVGTDDNGNPIWANITRPEDRTGDGGIDEYDPDTYVGDIYYDDTIGHWIGLDQHGRPVIVDEEGYPIPLEDLNIIPPQMGVPRQRPGGRVDQGPIDIGQRFFPYFYDAIGDRWIGIDRNGVFFLMEGAPDFSYDPATGYFTVLDETTGEFTVYDIDGNIIGGDPDDADTDNYRDYDPRPSLDPADFDTPIATDALNLANSILGIIQGGVTGSLLHVTIGIYSYQEGERFGLIIGSNHSDAIDDDDYNSVIPTAIAEGNALKENLTHGGFLNVVPAISPADDNGQSIPSVEVWFLPNTTEFVPPHLEGSNLEFLMQITALVEQRLRELCPVVTGRMRDSIDTQLRQPQGSFQGYEVGARIYYQQFVGSYRAAVDQTIQSFEAQFAQLPVPVSLSVTTILLAPHEANTFSTVGTGILVSLAPRNDDGFFGDFEFDPALQGIIRRFFNFLGI